MEFLTFNSTFCYALLMPRKEGNNETNPWVVVARYSEIGFIIPAAVLLGFIVGKLLDHFLHTTWIYLAGLIFGAIIGFVQMIRSAMQSTKSDES